MSEVALDAVDDDVAVVVKIRLRDLNAIDEKSVIIVDC